MTRNTSTGSVLEAMVFPALTRGGYSVETQKKVGTRCGGGTHKVDAVVTKADESIIISLK